MNKEEKNRVRQRLLDRIESDSYLTNEEELKKYVEKRKQEEKDFIKKVQTSSIEELVQEELEERKKEFNEELDELKKYYIEDIQSMKKDATNLLKKGYPKDYRDVYDNHYDLFTLQEMLELSEEAMLEKLVDKRRKRWENVEEIEEEFIELKDKYAGVTEEELNIYVDLLVQRSIISQMGVLKEKKVLLDVLENSPRKYEEYLMMDVSMEPDNYVHISDMKLLNHYEKEAKEGRKKSIGTFVKFAAGLGIPVATLATSLMAGLGVGLLETAILGLATPAGLIALIGAVVGGRALHQVLHNKKVVERLRETGLYDMFVEEAKINEQIDEFEISKGMKK